MSSRHLIIQPVDGCCQCAAIHDYWHFGHQTYIYMWLVRYYSIKEDEQQQVCNTNDGSNTSNVVSLIFHRLIIHY